jgi:hypothetical protein
VIGAAIEFYDVVVWLHVSSVVIGLGVLFAYPVIFGVATKLDPRSMPTVLRISETLGKVTGPFLVVIIATGIYLVADGDWGAGDFWLVGVYVIVVAIGAMGGMFFAPQGRRLIEIADRDIAAAGDGEVVWSPEYHGVQKGLGRGGMVANVLVLVAIFLMTTKPGA